MFTKEDIGSLPLPARKCEGDESNNLGQLFVTPEKISKKIKMMKGNKSPGVEGIPPKFLKEIVTEISIIYRMLQVPSKQQWTKNKEPSCFSWISVPPSIRSTITS